jgi:hypothetical protein
MNRLIRAAVCALLIAGVAACAAPDSSASGGAAPGGAARTRAVPAAVSDPLARLSADQIASRAISDMMAMPAIRVTAVTDEDYSTNTSLIVSGTATVLPGKACEVTLSAGRGLGTVMLVEIGKATWIKADDALWKDSGLGAAQIRAGTGKYVRLQPDESGMDSLCDAPASDVGGAGLVKAGMTTIDGRPALKLKAVSGYTGTLYVSVSARPLPLRLLSASSQGATMTFSYLSIPIKITAPPASQVVDGAGWGG